MSPELQKKIQSNDATVLSAIFHNANILHSYDVEHTYFLGNKTSLNQPTAEKKIISGLFACLYRLKHSIMLSPPLHTQTSSDFDGEMIKKKRKKSLECAVAQHSSKSTRSHINVTIFKIVLTPLEFSHNDIFN